jgi:hypothetical protein
MVHGKHVQQLSRIPRNNRRKSYPPVHMAMENPCSENFPASQASFAKGKHDQYPIIIQFLAHDHPY